MIGVALASLLCASSNGCPAGRCDGAAADARRRPRRSHSDVCPAGAATEHSSVRRSELLRDDRAREHRR